MNWIKNFVRRAFQACFGADDTPDNLWEACKKCGEMIFIAIWKIFKRVPGCDHHMRIGATARFQALFDKGEYEQICPMWRMTR